MKIIIIIIAIVGPPPGNVCFIDSAYRQLIQSASMSACLYTVLSAFHAYTGKKRHFIMSAVQSSPVQR